MKHDNNTNKRTNIHPSINPSLDPTSTPLEPAIQAIHNEKLRLALLSRDLRLQVLDSIANIASVSQVASSNEEGAAADAVRDVAVSLCLLVGEVGDLAALLRVASVAVQHHAGDAILGSGVELRHSIDHDGGALRVAGRDDDGVGALGGCLFEDVHGFGVGGCCGAAGKSVGADAGRVGASNALAGDVVAVGLLEAVAGGRADG